jgi:hypothetical protein
MKQATSPARDTRIDVIRAVALITIFINHVPGNPLEPFTSKNFGFSDAAEAFVLLSGVSAGFAYGLKFGPGFRLATTLRAWRRAGVLYIAQLGTTMASLGIFAFMAIHFAAPELLDKINIGPVIEDPAAAIVGLVTFGHQLGYNNILSMYAVVLLMMPVFLLIGSISLPAMVAASGGLWLVSGLAGIAPPNYPTDGVWFLNPFSWQFLFVIGLAATMHLKRGGRLPVHPMLVIATGSYIVLSFLWVRIPLWGIDASLGLPTVLTGFDKTYLSAPRLLHVLALGYLVAAIPAIANVARLNHDHPLATMGRHALPVFVAGTIIAIAAQAWREVYPLGPIADIGIVVAGIAVQFAIVGQIEWYRRVVSQSARPNQVSRPAAMRMDTGQDAILQPRRAEIRA